MKFSKRGKSSNDDNLANSEGELGKAEAEVEVGREKQDGEGSLKSFKSWKS